jgi:hypothetical protein
MIPLHSHRYARANDGKPGLDQVKQLTGRTTYEENRVKLSPTAKNTRRPSATPEPKLSDWKDLRIFFRLVFDVLRKSSEVN